MIDIEEVNLLEEQFKVFEKQEGAQYYKEISEKGSGVDIWKMYVFFCVLRDSTGTLQKN